MEFIYCFANASLTQRVLIYLQRKMRSRLAVVTVIFLNDLWIIRLKLKPSIDTDHCNNCLAVLKENGISYRPVSILIPAFKDLEAGSSATAVMKRHQIAIVSHGRPEPREIRHFQEHFIAGLGYCPQSLV